MRKKINNGWQPQNDYHTWNGSLNIKLLGLIVGVMGQLLDTDEIGFPDVIIPLKRIN